MKVGQLRKHEGEQGLFLLCPRCLNQYSACYGDYFVSPDEQEFECFSAKCENEPLVLARKVETYEEVEP